MPAVKPVKGIRKTTAFPSRSVGFSLPLFSFLGDGLETQLSQQVQTLFPNNGLGRLISHVIPSLKMGYSGVNVQLAYGELICRTGLLMKLQ